MKNWQGKIVCLSGYLQPNQDKTSKINPNTQENQNTKPH